MGHRIFWIVLAAFALPILVRFFWLFPGAYWPRSIATPDYMNLKMPVAPISTPRTPEISQKGGIVVLDLAHDNQFQLGEIRILTDAITQRGARVEVDSDAKTLRPQLKSAKAYIVVSPSLTFAADEIRDVQDFVSRGGRLAVFTDATHGLTLYDFFGNPIGNTPDVNSANPLLAPFGITVRADYLYDLVANEGNFRNVYLEASGKSDLTAGVDRVAFYGAHSLETNSGSTLLVGGGKTYSSETDALPGDDPTKGWAGALVSKNGNVLALGDFTFLMPPYNSVADNAALIDNIANFLLGGSRRAQLADYPYIFNGTAISVLPTSNIQITAEMTGALSRLQSVLEASGAQLSIIHNVSSADNLIVLGTFSPSDDLTQYIEPFDLALDESSEFVELPQFGKLGRLGNGILLFRARENGSTLVLLANTVNDLTALMDSLDSGDLSGCVLQGDVAACSIGFGGSFSEGTPTPEVPPASAGGG